MESRGDSILLPAFQTEINRFRRDLLFLTEHLAKLFSADGHLRFPDADAVEPRGKIGKRFLFIPHGQIALEKAIDGFKHIPFVLQLHQQQFFLFFLVRHKGLPFPFPGFSSI